MTLLDDCLTVSELPSGCAPELQGVRQATYHAGRESPCDTFACPRKQDCKERSLACSAFVRWTYSGGMVEPTPRTANRARFNRVFSEDDDE